MQQSFVSANDNLALIKGQLTEVNNQMFLTGINPKINVSFIDKLAILLAYVKDAAFDSNGNFSLQWFNPFKWAAYFNILKTILSLIWDIVISLRGSGINPIPLGLINSEKVS